MSGGFVNFTVSVRCILSMLSGGSVKVKIKTRQKHSVNVSTYSNYAEVRRYYRIIGLQLRGQLA